MDGINQEERAGNAWTVLCAVAKKKTLITYKELGNAIGVHHRAIRYVLGWIQAYCLDNHLPPMTILVVNGHSGRPGEGFIAWDADNIDAGLRKVYRRNWGADENPFAYAKTGLSGAELAKRLVREPSSAGDIYRLVKDRGAAQRIFRDALLLAYEGACAFCGLTFEDALQGAHIVVWSKASGHQKMAPSNGLLLCATHHRMFDTGLMVVGPAKTIVYYDPKSEDGSYSVADRHASIRLHGQPVRLPKDARHQTPPELWSWRYKHDEWNQPPWDFS